MKLERAYEFNVNPELVSSTKLYVTWINRTTKALSGWIRTKKDFDELYVSVDDTFESLK